MLLINYLIFDIKICIFLIITLKTIKLYKIFPKYNVSDLYLQTINNLITTYIQNINITGPTAIVLQEDNASDISTEVCKSIYLRDDLNEIILINPTDRDKCCNNFTSFFGIKTVFWITECFDSNFWEYFTNYTTFNMWDAGSYLFFLIKSYNICSVSFKNVFQNIWIEYRALNPVIINQCFEHGKGEPDKINVYEYNPYLNTITTIDSLNGNGFIDKNLDLYGYECKVAIKNEIDDIFEGAVKNKDYYGTYLEYHMMKIINEKLNYTLLYFTPDNDEYFDSLYDIPIKERPCVIGSASILSSKAMYLGCYPHEQQSARILVPKALRVPQYLSLILPFSVNMWTVYFISVPMIIMSLKILKKDMSLESWTFIEVMRVLLLGHFNWQTSKHKQRIFIMCCMYYSLVILNAYQGCITSYITVPQFYKDINTMTDLLNSELSVFAQSQVNQDETVAALIDEMSNPDNHDVIFQLLPRLTLSSDIKQVLDWMAFSRNVSFVTAEYYTDIFKNMDIYYRDGYPLLHVMEESLGLVLVVFEVPFSNPTKDRSDILTRRAYEHGFRVKIGKDIMFIMMTSGGTNHYQSSKLKPLKLEHLLLPFYFLLSGICLSVIVLCLEILLQKVLK